MNNMQPVILQLGTKESHEVRVGFQDHKHGIGPHPPQDLGREGANAWAVFKEDPSAIPVHLRKHVVHQESRARDQTTEHFGMLKKIAPKQQDLLGAQ